MFQFPQILLIEFWNVLKMEVDFLSTTCNRFFNMASRWLLRIFSILYMTRHGHCSRCYGFTQHKLFTLAILCKRMFSKLNNICSSACCLFGVRNRNWVDDLRWTFLRPFCFEHDFSQIFSIFLLRQFVNSIQFFQTFIRILKQNGIWNRSTDIIYINITKKTTNPQ